MLNESKKFIHKLNKFSFRRFTTTKPEELIKVKSLSKLAEFDARKLFNINKDVLVLKTKMPDTFVLYRASPKISLIFI